MHRVTAFSVSLLHNFTNFKSSFAAQIHKRIMITIQIMNARPCPSPIFHSIFIILFPPPCIHRSNEVFIRYQFHLILFDSLLYMCLESLPPPTPEMARGRILLQLLAAGLGIVTLFGIIAGDTFAFFLTMILGFMLYMSWSEFNYMLTLNLFILFAMQTVITYIQIIKLVQYYDIISNRNTAQVVYTIVKFVYFPTGTFFTHQAYKRFKQYAYTFAENQAFGDYQMLSFNTANQSQNRNQEYHQANQMNSSRAFTPFSGQGVTIG